MTWVKLNSCVIINTLNVVSITHIYNSDKYLLCLSNSNHYEINEEQKRKICKIIIKGDTYGKK